MIKVYTKNIRKELGLMTSERRQQLLSLLCVIRREKAEKIKIEDKQSRVILAGVFLQYILYKYCENGAFDDDVKVSPQDLLGEVHQENELDARVELCEATHMEISTYLLDASFVNWCRNFSYQIDEGGKPFLLDYPQVQFNMSHSGDWVVVAVGNETVGIDVEKRVPADKCKDIAKRFYHPDEVTDLDQNEDAMLEYRFLQYWTSKEAYVKYLGTGLRTPLNQFCVDMYSRSVKSETVEPSEAVTLILSSLDEEYELAVCIAKDLV